MTMAIITQEIIYEETSFQCIRNLECIDKEKNIT
jgi:hypothetical protein